MSCWGIWKILLMNSRIYNCFLLKKEHFKSGTAETISHSPLFYLDLLPFSYITLYTYTPIDVF